MRVTGPGGIWRLRFNRVDPHTPPDEAPPGFAPWFRLPERRNRDATIIFGHWAAMGLHMESGVMGIDSGCVWGRQLTAVRLEDRMVYQVEYADRRD